MSRPAWVIQLARTANAYLFSAGPAISPTGTVIASPVSMTVMPRVMLSVGFIEIVRGVPLISGSGRNDLQS